MTYKVTFAVLVRVETNEAPLDAGHWYTCALPTVKEQPSQHGEEGVKGNPGKSNVIFLLKPVMNVDDEVVAQTGHSVIPGVQVLLQVVAVDRY